MLHSKNLLLLLSFHAKYCDLTVSFWAVLEAKREGEVGVVLEELCGKSVPPKVVRVVCSLLQPFVHLVDPVVWLRHWHWTPGWSEPAEEPDFNYYILGKLALA